MKKLFFVSYDLVKPGKDYTALFQKLALLGAVRILYSQWALRSYRTSTQLYNEICESMDANDRLIVSEVTDFAAWNLMADVKKIAA